MSFAAWKPPGGRQKGIPPPGSLPMVPSQVGRTSPPPGMGSVSDWDGVFKVNALQGDTEELLGLSRTFPVFSTPHPQNTGCPEN